MPSRFPRAFPIGFLLASLVSCGSSTGPEAGTLDEPVTPARGALLIIVDTLRADYVGAYGSDRDLTPHMDALASDALVFRNGVAASSWTRASMASIFTSQYPTSVSMLTWRDVLSDDLETLAETLALSGVHTLGVSTNGNAGERFGFKQGFEQFADELPRRGYPDDLENALLHEGKLAGGEQKMVSAEDVTKELLRLVDEVEPENPFFLFAHYIDPHDPYMEHPGLLPEPEPPGRFNGSRAQLGRLDALLPKERTRADLDRIRYLYAGEVKHCDIWLGKLFDGLRSRGLLDEMLVVLTSDHGEGLWDHGRRGHARDLYEEMIQIPFIVRFPSRTAIQPAQVEGLVSHVDIAPTILGAFGVPLPSDYQGRDLGLAARRNELNRHGGFAYSEMNFEGIDLESVSNGEQKLIRNRSMDGRKPGPFEYVVKQGDTLRKLSRSFHGLTSPVQAILKANPGLAEPGTPGNQVVLEPGSVLHMPALWRRPDDLFELFSLTQDPREQLDLSSTLLGKTTPLLQVLSQIAADNLVRQIEGLQISLEDLDEETLAELRGLGYLGD